MATVTNFAWGWRWRPRRTGEWNFICRGGSSSASTCCCFFMLSCRSTLPLYTPPFHTTKNSRFWASFSFQDSYSLENDIDNTNECSKDSNDMFKDLGIVGSLQSSTEYPQSGRVCTNILLALNILVYVGQIVSQGKITLWGTKINNLIDNGQIWRLVTSSFLHGNIMHLLVNCYSLNSVGPTVEKLSGPKRYFGVYMASAITSAMMSYYLSKAPSLGASGAIFGLVGSLTVFTFRHKNLMIGGQQHLSAISFNIAVNMVLGFSCPGIDNWGHIGGLIGGAFLSWLLGPAFSFQSVKGEKHILLVDKPPISYLSFWRRRSP